MFCPRCGAENNLNQKYCRHCGLQLATSRIALTGNVDEALTSYKKGEWLVLGGSIFLICAALAALANFFLNSGPWNYPVIINLLIGLVSAIPMITIGTIRLRLARRALHLTDEQSQLRNEDLQKTDPLFQAQPTDRLLSSAPVTSVTEGTTRHLSTSERKH